MYTYPVLVNCLPAVNKMKVVCLVNTCSTSVIDVLDLNSYDVCVMCQANAAYVGTILGRIQTEPNKRSHKVIIEHFCVLENHRKNGYGTQLMEQFKSGIRTADIAEICLTPDSPLWQQGMMEQFGWWRDPSDKDPNTLKFQWVPQL
jgi:hypothetical protein